VLKPSILQRATVWLCLAVAVLTGLTPAQGVMLCLEPDGDLCIEIASSADTCGGCEVEAHDAEPAAEHEVSTDDPCCSCVDVPVPGFCQDRQVLPKTIEFQLGPWLAQVETLVLPSIHTIRAASYRTRGEEPRPPDSLALIRSVVLLV
jgi:hypothetical protein